jgi:hypothetical protein
MRIVKIVISTTYAERLAPRVLIRNGEESVLWGECGVEIHPYLRMASEVVVKENPRSHRREPVTHLPG